MTFNRLLCFACLTFYIICCGKNGFSQTEQSKRLTINDVTIARDKPTVYLCVDRELMKKKKEAKDDNLWVRVYNNTIWTIKFQAVRPGTPPQLFELPNGKFMTALTNNSIAFPEYQFESKKDAKEFDKPNWEISESSIFCYRTSPPYLKFQLSISKMGFYIWNTNTNGNLLEQLVTNHTHRAIESISISMTSPISQEKYVINLEIEHK
jgi:hypothetical protein